ncbi:peritrophin-48 [Procambarus clarkii]|uniref:peritrophin-48 n=1 Tax=Procambarus clarkii TaxID=6728 RepID=UPI001E6701EC|nr:peritrophin-44-like [Procambarus clarkii]
MAASTSLRVLTLPVVLVLCLVSPELVHTSKTESCPAADCSGVADGHMVPDPTNCRQFYFCVGEEPTAEAFPCDDGMVFDSAESKCVVGDTCSNICSTCSYECPDSPEPPPYFSDRYDCKIYYDCGSKGQHSCPNDNQFFDGSHCQSDESKCCSCKPYCSESDLYGGVIDPTNCKRYFFCSEIGIPEYSTECVSGNFDLISGTCSDTAPCLTYCTNVVGPDGCIDRYTCEVLGNHAKCPQRCDPHYYHCSSSNMGQVVTASSCSSGQYYHPDTGLCVTGANCPYPDPGE